jgi:hypothetical protein
MMSSLHQSTQQGSIPNEKLASTFSMMVKFIRIFRALHVLTEPSLNLVGYFVGVSNDFFFYLLNYKELWMASFFVNVMEAYLLLLNKTSQSTELT